MDRTAAIRGVEDSDEAMVDGQGELEAEQQRKTERKSAAAKEKQGPRDAGGAATLLRRFDRPFGPFELPSRLRLGVVTVRFDPLVLLPRNCAALLSL